MSPISALISPSSEQPTAAVSHAEAAFLYFEPTALRVFGYLKCLAYSENRVWEYVRGCAAIKTLRPFQLIVTVPRIAEKCGLSLQMVRTALRKILAARLLRKDEVVKWRGRNYATLYTLQPALAPQPTLESTLELTLESTDNNRSKEIRRDPNRSYKKELRPECPEAVRVVQEWEKLVGCLDQGYKMKFCRPEIHLTPKQADEMLVTLERLLKAGAMVDVPGGLSRPLIVRRVLNEARRARHARETQKAREESEARRLEAFDESKGPMLSEMGQTFVHLVRGGMDIDDAIDRVRKDADGPISAFEVRSHLAEVIAWLPT